MSQQPPPPESTPQWPRRARGARLASLVAIGLLILAGCAEDKPLNTFEPRGPKARGIDNLMLYIWPIMGVVFVAVIGVTVWLAVKNRVDGDTLDPEDLPAQTHGNTRLEVTWTILPAVLLAAISVPLVANIWKLEEKSPSNLQVLVVGQQWTWEFHYDTNGNGFFADGNGDGVVDDKDKKLPLNLSLDKADLVTSNDLVIPVDQQVDLTITSRDVIHSFWIPRLNGKRDAVPGKFSTWSLQADDPGKYTGWCTEFCGLSHARMRMATIALSSADFDAWKANQMKPAAVPDKDKEPEAYAGREIFKNQCVACHVVTDGSTDLSYAADFQANLTSGEAPNLTHFATRSAFAGAIFNQYVGSGTDAADDALDVADYLKLSELSRQSGSKYRWNTPQLKRWVSNAPEQKAMSPDDKRGMLPFPQLTDTQLNQVVAYLATLD
jgi:cytochrome c oxidase subunit II